MTKQNVLVSDTKSTFNMAIMPTSNSPIITRPVQKPPAAPGGYISISTKKLLKNLEINGEARINTWVDSMKASSPTHIKATPSPADHDQSSWIVSILVN
jgi:trehalose 6-phosphate phosphatase